jgi:RNA polymerase sigma-70 factor (ECF subfamily)
VEGRPLEDADLVEQARRGNADAYAELVRRYQDLAFRTAYLVTGLPSDAEDAAQEAFVKAYRALPGFRSGAPLRPWLLRIVANEARNRRRSSGRRAVLTLRAADEHASVDAAPSAEAAVLANEGRRTMIEALNAMREDDRLVITCRYFLDLNEAEMADVLGIRRGTVKSRLSRALVRLRSIVEERTDG